MNLLPLLSQHYLLSLSMAMLFVLWLNRIALPLKLVLDLGTMVQIVFIGSSLSFDVAARVHRVALD